MDSIKEKATETAAAAAELAKNAAKSAKLNLQIAAYDYLEDALTDVLIKKLQSSSAEDMPITLPEFFASMVNCGTISLAQILEASSGEQKVAGDLIRAQYPDFSLSEEDAVDRGKECLSGAILNDQLSSRQMISILQEQGKINLSEEQSAQFSSGALSPLSIVITCWRKANLPLPIRI